MSGQSTYMGGGSEVGDFIAMPDCGAVVVKSSGKELLRTGTVIAGASYPIAQAIDHLKCMGSSGTQATTIAASYVDIATNGASKWVAAYGDFTNLIYSTDNGATWATVAHSLGYAATTVCWDTTNSLFICAGNSAAVFYTSTQTSASIGSAWTLRTGTAITSGSQSTAKIRASSAEVIMTCGGATTGGASRSTSGTSWTTVNFVASPYATLISSSLISLGSSIWHVSGNGTSTANQRSTDGGATWSTVAAGSAQVRQGAFGASLCIGFDGSGNLYTSATAATGTWTNRGNPFGSWAAIQCMHDGTRFIASLKHLYAPSTSAYKNAYGYSTDGLTWKIRGIINKSWNDQYEIILRSDGANICALPIGGSGVVYGTFADTTYIGMPYATVSSSGNGVNIVQPPIYYVRIK